MDCVLFNGVIFRSSIKVVVSTRGATMAEFKSLVLYMMEDERTAIQKIKDQTGFRTQLDAIRESIRRLSEKCGGDPKKCSSVIRKLILEHSEEAREAKPHANGRATTIQLNVLSIKFLDKAADQWSLERTVLIRALIRAAGAGDL